MASVNTFNGRTVYGVFGFDGKELCGIATSKAEAERKVDFFSRGGKYTCDVVEGINPIVRRVADKARRSLVVRSTEVTAKSIRDYLAGKATTWEACRYRQFV